MSDSVFTKIHKGGIPGELLYEDDKCFVILSITPHNPGHLLLIPVEETADWQAVDPKVFEHMMGLAQKLGKIIKRLYNAPKVALSCVGFEVPHTHIHIFSLFEIADIDHDKARATTPEALRVEADKIRAELKNEGLIK